VDHPDGFLRSGEDALTYIDGENMSINQKIQNRGWHAEIGATYCGQLTK